jgi:hypothetical protein
MMSLFGVIGVESEVFQRAALQRWARYRISFKGFNRVKYHSRFGSTYSSQQPVINPSPPSIIFHLIPHIYSNVVLYPSSIGFGIGYTSNST